MIETEKLETILTKCRIIIEFAPLPESVLGYYNYDGDYYIILINECIRNNERLYRTVLAEEIGHYRTTIGDITPRKYMCYQDRIEIDKKELLALKWATDFLIPTSKVLDVLRDKLATSFSQLADYFLVTQDFLLQKFKFMARKNPIWDIDDIRYLYLYNLPSIHIFEKI
ncbi:ImmA/IrrE family metallo-endopeptidase [Petroclostridium sp. X23]|uniref:ImmA/IrrE family metallo-endopeptidase n=1 Tax=Petroclostridium sp. X23 TaxID=3045146 RepID=UPI0024AE5430|nr:ImmA/IrrE family metallo-endopeptidase [Petroclostridium sp. X23]WHH58257.1 ImmA/IrrE family metallo-endopeptidase [Petroclostridium sp. X23]